MAADADTVMEPPSATPPLSSGQPLSQTHQANIDRQVKLKRRFEELEGELNSETHASPERNVRMREEIDNLLGEIDELKKNAISTSNGSVGENHTSSGSSNTHSPRRNGNTLASNGAQETGNGNGQSTATSSHMNGSQPETAAVNQTVDGGDVEMKNGAAANYSNSGHSTTVTQQQATNQRDGGVFENQRSPRRVGKQAISTVAVGLEARGTTAQLGTQPAKPMSSGTGNTAVPESSNAIAEGSSSHQPHASSSTLAHALGHASSTPSTPSQGNSQDTHNAAHTNAHLTQNSPSIESILKVAEAAVAAQNAANQVKLAAMASAQSKSTVDPNLDPSLRPDSGKASSSSGEGSNGNNPPAATSRPAPQVDTATTSNSNATASSSTTPSSVSTPSSSLSNNPYLSLSTNLLSRVNPGATTPTGHPMFMHPYSLFYPPPGTPVTPNGPSYPIPYNPYYYLAAPMPSPNGMYSPPANFPPPMQQQRPPPPPGEPQRPKPKRLKAHTVTTKSFSIPMVPRDKKGKPMLPLNVGIMTVINLGEVCMREHFHTERYIFPVGYEVTRRYLSTVDPTIEVVYHCTILDGGDGPKFQIIPSDRPDKPIIAGTATGAWSNIVKQANAIRNRQHSNSVSGPDFFGLGQNTIKHLIQELPNSDRLRDYVWQNFVEGGPLGGRHAAVIPALPEEYDASMPIGAYYPKRDVNPNPNLPRGMSHYPQHIIAQAEAQKMQRLQQQQQQQQHHQQQQQQQQQQPVAGPSGSTSSSQPTNQDMANPNPQHDPAHIMLSLGATADALNIQQYQPLPQNQTQPASGAPEKRATRSSIGGSNGTTSPASAARQTRPRGNQQQQQQQQQAPTPTVGAEGIALNADRTMPTTTFASIMNAYPAPGVPTPMPSQATTSTS